METYETFVANVKDNVGHHLFNSKHFHEPDSVGYIDQYRMQIDSSLKTDERRGFINNFFITVNGIFLPFLIQTFPLGTKEPSKQLMLFLFVCVGLILSYEWLFIIRLYKRLNYINYEITKAIEENLPCRIFSVKSEILAEHTNLEKANVFLDRETSLPGIFFCIFLVYFLLSVTSWLMA